MTRMKIVAKNRRATYDYQIQDTLVAGLVLAGAEVKSVKLGHASLKGSFVTLRGGEAWLNNAQITPYAYAGGQNRPEPTRVRKLLLHKKELAILAGHKQNGLSIVPLALGVQRNLIKLEIGVGRGKKAYDKRETIKRRTQEREAAAAIVKGARR